MLIALSFLNLILIVYIDFVWVVSICLLPGILLILKKKGSLTAGIVVTTVFGSALLFFGPLIYFFTYGELSKTYHVSPDEQYIAIEYISTDGGLAANEFVMLSKNHSPNYIQRIDFYFCFNFVHLYNNIY